MAKVYKTTFKLRRGKAAEWSSVNPILAVGEPGFEIDTFKLKIGDGSTAYNDLPYIADAAAINSSVEEGSIIFVGNAESLPVEGKTEVFYAVLDEKQLKTWDLMTSTYVDWIDKTDYVTQETFQEVSEQVTKIEENVTNITQVSVVDVTDDDADNIEEEGDILYVRKSGEWIPLTAENTILQDITQQMVEATSKDYGSIDDEV